jgi:hypothetical protein
MDAWIASVDSLLLMASLLKRGEDATSATSIEVRPFFWQ